MLTLALVGLVGFVGGLITGISPCVLPVVWPGARGHHGGRCDGAGPASIGELAVPFEMALPSFLKHIRYLERTGWISTRKSGRVRTCTLERGSFDAIESWLGEQRSIWDERTDRLERFVTTTGKESSA